MRSSWTLKQPFGWIFKFLITLFILLSIPLVVVTIWVNQELRPVSSEAKEKIFVIKKDESVSSFSRRLHEEKLVRNTFIFRVYLKLSGLDEKIQAGSFKLSGNKSVEELAQLLTTGRVDKWITFVEGLRKEEVVEILSKDFEINKARFLDKATEGELFPDTYLVPVNADGEKVISIFKANFNEKFDEELQEKAKAAGLTKKETLNLASIVERESKSEKERPVIAGILMKRWKEGMNLGADATTQYALGYSSEEKTWWRKNLTDQDLSVDSLYNTRKNIGLPPGPICSPGLASIEAVLSPTDSQYYFYLHDKDGGVHYSKTFEEHQQKIRDYL